MILEHEIPNGCRLYFGKNARKKRELEQTLANFFYDKGFEEIVTPNFSYSGHQSIDNESQLIRINDEKNNQVALRADSTLDVARIITKRLGRTTSHKKWFYIQPVFSYPTSENYQIGCEWLEHKEISDIINLTAEVLNTIEITPLIQITNINIPKLVSKELGIDLALFKNGEIATLFAMDIKWLSTLLKVASISDLENVKPMLPESLQVEVQKLLDVANEVTYENIAVSPLYYAPMKYYDDLYFRVIEGNYTLAKGGKYHSDDICSQGFAFYSDNLLKILED
jgi:ATP phosphoribosyltransferase regulatory subunit HisZ